MNTSIPWNREMLTRFRHKIDRYTIATNENVHWDFELLRDFMDDFDTDLLSFNHACWNAAFPEFNERKNVLPLLETLRNQVLN